MGHTRVTRNSTARIHIFRLEQKLKRSLAEAIAKDVRRLAPRDTGMMADNVVVAEEPDGRVRVEVLGGGEHLDPRVPIWVEFGTGPHWIISGGFALHMKRPYPLRNRETGQVFGPVVWHPGSPAQPFMRPAAYRKRRLGRGGVVR